MCMKCWIDAILFIEESGNFLTNLSSRLTYGLSVKEKREILIRPIPLTSFDILARTSSAAPSRKLLRGFPILVGELAGIGK
jgi:hypothetical protein